MLLKPYISSTLFLFIFSIHAFTDEGTGKRTTTILPETDSVATLTDPVLLRFIKAPYPKKLVKKGIEGTVALDIFITKEGTVDSVVLIRGVHPQLDSLAVHAASEFKFTPATSNGNPEAVVLSYGYTFSIDQILDTLKQHLCFSGILREYGTRNTIRDAEISVKIIDYTRAVKSIDVPLKQYLERIGRFTGQQLHNGKISTRSDSSGRFRFYSLPAVACSIQVTSGEHKNFSSKINLYTDSVVTARYWLKRAMDQHYEITVYGKKEQTEVTARTFSARELGRVSGAAGDAIKAIQTLPGVARPRYGGAEIIVRGSEMNDNRFFFEGIELPYLFHTNYGVPKSVFNTMMLSALDFYPGGYGVRYGDVTGGVVNVAGRTAKRDRWHGILTLGFPEINIFFERPIGKNAGVMISGTHSYLFEYAKFAADNFSDDEFPLPSVPSYWDLVVRAEAGKSDNRIFAMFIGSGDKFEAASPQAVNGSPEIDPDIDRLKIQKGFIMGIAGWDKKFSSTLSNRLRLSTGQTESGYTEFGQLSYDVSGIDNYIRNELTWTAADGFTINSGVDLAIKPYTAHLKANGDSLYQDTSHFLIGPCAAFMNLTYTHGSFTFLPGLRYDYYPQLDYMGSTIPEFWNYTFNNLNRFSGDPSARFMVLYKINDAHTIKSAWGTYNQAPRVPDGAEYGRSIVPMLAAIINKYGNPRLPSAKASHLVVGNEWQPSEKLMLDISAYYNRQWDRPRYPTTKDYLEEPDLPAVLDNGRARMFGIELFVRYTLQEKISGWLSYSFGRSQQYSNDKKVWQLSSHDILNDVQLITNCRLSRHVTLGSRLRYTDGFPFTPVVDVSYDASEMRYLPVWGESFSKRQTPFIGLDIRIERRKEYKRFIQCFFYEITNIVHFLTFIKDKNGKPLYNPGEFPLWYYDYSGKSNLPAWPFMAFGNTLYF